MSKTVKTTEKLPAIWEKHCKQNQDC